ncbi:phosphatidylinositol mannoside acyltransferase [Janibacter hoylei]|uniref:phosphatidylinositol mannoside acyltransferase n=1 Tax=Janibacter hoylei TaxID=364298 RepID=UPI0021A71CB2|nr:phosphatidylinositol mannoside acyltransferase [Janibacter hoylei]MCT2293448.1 phosphatidylinositol mannoside acyltransferase [Janibacter hoylei]
MSRLRHRATVWAFLLAWRVLRLLPEGLAYRLFDLAADRTYAANSGSVQRLRANYARVRPELTAAELEALVAKGVRAALRYYVEAFRLPAVTGEQVDSRVRFEGAMPQLKEHLRAGRPVLAFLGHTGNWDLAGVWCARHLGTVVTVAERLEPEEMFRAFLDYRESLGMVIHPAEHGTFARLREQLATGEPVVMPLLADRDLSATGVEVDLCGHRARMAAGPAALAVETGLPLYPVTLRHERLGRTWGMVVTIHDAVDVPSAECANAVARTTQACADSFGRAITEHTEDWHMMQRVFVEDLDPARDAERRRAA